MQWCEQIIIMISPKLCFEVFFWGASWALQFGTEISTSSTSYLQTYTNFITFSFYHAYAKRYTIIYVYIYTYHITIASCNTHVPHDDIPIPSISIHPLRSSSINGSQLAPLTRQMYLLASQRMRDETMFFFGLSKIARFHNSLKKTVEIGSLPPIIHKVLYIPGGERFLPSTVWVVSTAQTCGSEVSTAKNYVILWQFQLIRNNICSTGGFNCLKVCWESRSFHDTVPLILLWGAAWMSRSARTTL